MRDITQIVPVLKKEGFPNEVVKSICEINTEKQVREFYSEGRPRIYFFRYHFGLGKSTYGLMNLTCGDIFIAETHTQLKESMENFQQLRHDDCKRVVGWDIFIGYNYSLDKNGNRQLESPTREQKEKCPDEILELWTKEPQILHRMRKETNQALNSQDKRRDARSQAV